MGNKNRGAADAALGRGERPGGVRPTLRWAAEKGPGGGAADAALGRGEGLGGVRPTLRWAAEKGPGGGAADAALGRGERLGGGTRCGTTSIPLRSMSVARASPYENPGK